MMQKYEPVCMNFRLGKHNLTENTDDDSIEETITMTIYVIDKRRGVPESEIYTVDTFKTNAKGFITRRNVALDYGSGTAWEKIQEWLEHMDVDPVFYPYTIDNILRCSSYQVPTGCSLSLSVFLEITDALGPYHQMTDAPLLMDCPIDVTYSSRNDKKQTITVFIYCQDTREGMKSDNAATFEESVEVLFPRPGTPRYGPGCSLEMVEGWLDQMGIDPYCYPYAIETILKCARASYKESDGRSLELDVHLKILDAKQLFPTD